MEAIERQRLAVAIDGRIAAGHDELLLILPARFSTLPILWPVGSMKGCASGQSFGRSYANVADMPSKEFFVPRSRIVPDAVKPSTSLARGATRSSSRIVADFAFMSADRSLVSSTV